MMPLCSWSRDRTPLLPCEAHISASYCQTRGCAEIFGTRRPGVPRVAACAHRTRLKLDLPADLDHASSRQMEHVDGMHRIAQHEGEQRNLPAPQSPATFGPHD